MSFKINKNSAHFKFLTWYKSVSQQKPKESVWNYYFLPNNFCQYWRQTVINPLMRFGFNISSLILSGFLLYKSVSWGGAGFIILPIAILIAVAIAVMGYYLITAGEYGIPKIRNKFRQIFIDFDDDSLIGMAYKSHKEKICVDVEYVKEDHE